LAIDLAAVCISAAHGSEQAMRDSTRVNSDLDVSDFWIDATAAATHHSAAILTIHELSNRIANAISLRRLPHMKTKVKNMFAHILLIHGFIARYPLNIRTRVPCIE
jgi:hypothetical protein